MGYMGGMTNLQSRKLGKATSVLPTITITTPVALSSHQIYEAPITITFTVVNPTSTYKISYSTDSGVTWTTITTTALFTYDWIVPDSLADVGTIQIKVSSVKYPTAFSTVTFDMWGALFNGGEHTVIGYIVTYFQNEEFNGGEITDIGVI